MSNMSYCRFWNTANDLSDCVDALEELADGAPQSDTPLSDEELRAAQRLVRLCLDVVALISDAADVDEVSSIDDSRDEVDQIISDWNASARRAVEAHENEINLPTDEERSA